MREAYEWDENIVNSVKQFQLADCSDTAAFIVGPIMITKLNCITFNEFDIIEEKTLNYDYVHFM